MRGMRLDGAVPTGHQPTLGIMVLLDRSGSMTAIRDQMETAFADFVQAQRAAHPGTWLTLVQFDRMSPYRGPELCEEVVYDRAPIECVGGLALKPRGDTPLRQALVAFAGRAQAIIADPDDQTDRLLCVVVTDGQHNVPTDITWAQVREAMQGLETVASEVLWLGTEAALLEARDQVGQQFTVHGASVAFDPTDVNYAYGALQAGAMAFARGASAKAASSAYLSATEGLLRSAKAAGQGTLSKAQVDEAVEQAVRTTTGPAVAGEER